LRAQAAQLSGDRATARRIYESMLASTDTELLGMRGLFLEAEREGETEAAKQFAERAMALNPSLSWPVDALFDLQCKRHDWAGALQTLAVARKNGHVEKASAERRRAVLLTAQAQDLEDKDPERALNLALDAHKLAADLVPAGAIAGRLLASRGSTPKATRILQQTWQKSPHPDLATAYAYARLGDSPRDRLDRVKKLAQLNPHSAESAIAVANAAIEAKDYAEARNALAPLMESRLTQRACTLMARIEGEEHGDKGRVREWLARAVNAPRDPAWTADSIVSEQWAAVSPVTGALDAFAWRVPVESMEKTADEIVARKLEELVALGAPLEVAADAKDVTPPEDKSGGHEKGADGKPAFAKNVPAKPVAADEVVDADAIEEPAPVAAQPAAEKPNSEVAATAPPPRNDNQAEAAERPAKANAGHGDDQLQASATPLALVGEAQTDKSRKGSATQVAAKSDVVAETPVTAATGPVEPAGSPDAGRATATAAKPDGSHPTRDATAPAGGPQRSAAVAARGAQPSGGKLQPQKAARSTAGEARIFISPRAPDDPGPEGEVSDVPTGPMKPFRHGAA